MQNSLQPKMPYGEMPYGSHYGEQTYGPKVNSYMIGLLALFVILLIFFIWRSCGKKLLYGKHHGKHAEGKYPGMEPAPMAKAPMAPAAMAPAAMAPAAAPQKSSFAVSPQAAAQQAAPHAAAPHAAEPANHGFTDPYAQINNFIDNARGMRASDLANHVPSPWTVPGEIARYEKSKMPWQEAALLDRMHQAGVTVTPEMASIADQSMWVSQTAESNADYDTEHAFDSHHDAVGYHKQSPMDYNSHISDTVLDERAVQNHRKWADAMMPWSGVSTSPDTMDEAMEASVNFQGLRRPQPIAQHNQLQVTERDMFTFLGNSQFKFLG